MSPEQPDLALEQEVSLELWPYTMEFRGEVVAVGEEPQGMDDKGGIITWASGAKFRIADGEIVNHETGDRVNLDPGTYTLDKAGFARDLDDER